MTGSSETTRKRSTTRGSARAAGRGAKRASADDAGRTRRIASELTERIGRHKYDMWFGTTTKLKVKGDRLEVATDSQFVADWIDSHFGEALRGVAEETIGAGASIAVRVAPDLFRPRAGGGDEGPKEAAPAAARPAAGRATRSRGSRRARTARPVQLRRLEDFVVGSSNDLAYAAARRIVDDPDSSSISPLFVYGECGVGKTHLVQGVCRRFEETSGRPQAVRYVTGEQFTNDYIAALRKSGIDAFRGRTRKLDLLVVDDVHFLSNKVATQSEFLHTVDALDLSGARLVLASDEHPRHIKRFSQALISRFLSGMVVKIHRPDRDTRLKLIGAIAAERGLRIRTSALEAIAARCVGSVREIEGVVTKLTAMSQLAGGDEGSEVGMVLVEQLFRDQAWQPSSPVRVTRIIDVVCDRLGVDRADLLGSGRHRRVVLARGLIAFLAREMTTLSYPEIADALGRAYHSTVHTAAQRLRRQIEQGVAVDVGAESQPTTLREFVDQLRHQIVRESGHGR